MFTTRSVRGRTGTRMTASDDDWDWEFTDPAEREHGTLQPHEQEPIVSKLDEIVNE